MQVTACIPSIPPRAGRLLAAIGSVIDQNRQADAISVAIDTERRGAWHTRNRALAGATTDWVAFLDDDDVWRPAHLERLCAHAEETGADMVYPWYDVVGGRDPHAHMFGRPWDPEHPAQTTICFLVRRSLMLDIGGFKNPEVDALDQFGNRTGEDYAAVIAMDRAGAKIVHLPERTWIWNHHGLNTSGKPDRW